jgi:hypothetical protein
MSLPIRLQGIVVFREVGMRSSSFCNRQHGRNEPEAPASRSVFRKRAVAMTDFHTLVIVSAMASPTASLFSAIVRCSLRLR